MNTANKITLIRIALIPVFLFFLLTDAVLYSRFIAVAVFLIASATDSLDGYIARKYNQITDFGKFIDPLADKTLVISALVGMVQLGQICAVAVIMIIAREFAVTGLRIVAASSGRVIAAAMSGKLKTVIQIVTIAFIIASYEFIGVFPFLTYANSALVWITVIITIYSGAEYIIKNKDVINYTK